MYRFSEIEKHIISELIALEGRQVMLGNLIIKKVNRALIKLNPSENSATMILHHYMGSTNENMKLYEKVYKDNMELLCTAIGLIEYLKAKHLVNDYRAIPEGQLKKEFTLGFHPKPELEGINWKIEDQELVQSLIDLSHRVFIPTSDLKAIVKNGYRTHEEVKFQKQLTATWVAIIIALFFGLYGLIKEDCSSPSKDITKAINSDVFPQCLSCAKRA